MKQYTSRELSEKLVKLGCKSQSGKYWGSWDVPFQFRTDGVDRELPKRPAFEFEDFCGTHEQAHINIGLLIFYIQNKRNKVVRDGGLVILSGKILASEPMSGHDLVLEMIKSGDWLKYLEKVMEERE